eukprot:CAMPEP_0117019018 /NCGR_PEP_ID=MMETSP0472-20121206/14644_1 /TAXON_ID=693140 ORGANISM="Tiarina fusus, Strain LIS" /NCGR_SAMPLE_ID=MMETSP0472 /ASSEMBLY_ACC=CAM_ASM_000603 /LENGTH=108 /DNA_ID=CAMNT_0004723859 /DNA_START=819 /DNA_END=1142 /DNA_ORIENTATION=-
MSTDDLCEVFDIEEETVAENDEEIVVRFPQRVVDQFWNMVVDFEGKNVTRHAAAKILESRHALRLLNSRSSTPDRTCNLYSVMLPHNVAKQIMKLKEMHLDETDSETQ